MRLSIRLAGSKRLIIFRSSAFREVYKEQNEIRSASCRRVRGCELTRAGRQVPLLSRMLRLMSKGMPLLVRIGLPGASAGVYEGLSRRLQGCRNRCVVRSFGDLMLH